MGYCYDGWWLNQQFCCWEIDTEDDACDSWHEWSDFTPARWVLYVIVAVRSVSIDEKYSTDVFPAVGFVRIYCSPPCSVLGEICRRVRDIRDQVHLGWVRNEGVPRGLDVCDKKPDFGGVVSQIAPGRV
jgi:hypothetical protein